MAITKMAQELFTLVAAGVEDLDIGEHDCTLVNHTEPARFHLPQHER